MKLLSATPRLPICLACLAGLAVPVNANDDLPDPVVVVADSDHPPFEWADGDATYGYNAEIVGAIDEGTEREVRFEARPWSEAMAMLREGEAHAAPMVPSPKRQEWLLFTAPVYHMQTVAFGPEDLPDIGRIEGLEGKRVAAQEDAGMDEYLIESNVSVETTVLTDSSTQSLRAVADGKADYALVDRAVGHAIIDTKGLPLQQRSGPFWGNPYALAVPREHAPVRDWLNDELDRLAANGTLASIYTRWRNDLEPRREEFGVTGYVAIAIAASALLLTGILYAGRRALRARIRQTTQSLRDELHLRREAEDRLLRQARIDPDTDLPRREHFLELAGQTLADHSKEASSTDHQLVMATIQLGLTTEHAQVFGREIVDDKIRQIAQRLRNRPDPSAGYLGGGSFAMLTTRAQLDDLMNEVRQPVTLSGLELEPAPIFGIAFHPEHGREAQLLLQRAELSLVSATRHGWHERSFDWSLEPQPEDLELIREFRQSDGQDLQLLFQPQVEIETGQVIGLEALVRWHHPKRGLISPGRFVPLLEQAGNIGQLTNHVLRHALEARTQLKAQEDPCPISVNIAPHDLMDNQFPERVMEQIKQSGLRPDDLRLELTETAFVDNPVQIATQMGRLREMGIRGAIDDFGTGYTSLRYLSDFPVDTIKIDRSFISRISRSHQHRIIVRSVVAMAQELGLGVIAEGAEDQATLQCLKEANCQTVQGFVFARAMPLDEIPRTLKPEDVTPEAG